MPAELEPCGVRRLAVPLSSAFAADFLVLSTFFWGVRRDLLFAAAPDFAFARGGVFRFFAGLAPVFPETFLDAVFFVRVRLFFFFAFFFMLSVRISFLAAALFCQPSTVTIRKRARKLMKRLAPGKRVWGRRAPCH